MTQLNFQQLFESAVALLGMTFITLTRICGAVLSLLKETKQLRLAIENERAEQGARAPSAMPPPIRMKKVP